jgi:hypothetical protein
LVPVEPEVVVLVDGLVLVVPEVLVDEPRSLDVLAPGLALPVLEVVLLPEVPLPMVDEVPEVEPLVLVAGSVLVVPVAPVLTLPLFVPVVVLVVPVVVPEVPVFDASVPEVWADTPMAVTRAAAAAMRVRLVGSFDM